MTKLLVLQGTPFCNIDCKYCYLPDRANPRRMTLQTFETVLAKVISSNIFGGDFRMCWHAGEPLAIPPAFYRECMKVAARLTPAGLNIAQSFQTNAVLINEQWCDYFQDYNASVGISVDGPEFLHDLNRRDRLGRGTFARVQRGIERLRSRNMPFGVICVLTAAHLDHARAIFDFLREIGPAVVSFNIDEIEGPNIASSYGQSGAIDRFRAFLREFLELNASSEPALNLVNLYVDVLEARAPPDNDQVTPWHIVSVDIDGNICTFSPELLGQRSSTFGNFALGNLLTDDFAHIASGIAFHELAAEVKAGVEACRRECEYFQWCGGGAPANKFFELGTFAGTETMYCRVMRKAVCDVNLEMIERKARAAFDRTPGQGAASK